MIFIREIIGKTKHANFVFYTSFVEIVFWFDLELNSFILGIAFTLNSVGVLPVNYLRNTDLYKADNLLTNARQILAQYQIKEHMRKETSLIFRQFVELTGKLALHPAWLSCEGSIFHHGKFLSAR